MTNLCSISVSKSNFMFMLKVGWTETVASSLFSKSGSLVIWKKCIGLGKGGELQYDLRSKEVLKILKTLRNFVNAVIAIFNIVLNVNVELSFPYLKALSCSSECFNPICHSLSQWVTKFYIIKSYILVLKTYLKTSSSLSLLCCGDSVF